MTDAKSPEPSIEEILASIRKIISDDDVDAEAGQHAAEPAPEESSGEDEVLELTDVIFSVPPEPANSEPVSTPEFIEDPPSNITILPQPMPEPSDPESYAQSPRPPAMSDSELLSSETLAVATGAFAKLAHPESTAEQASAPILSSGVTVEDLARELLKPMLREWIDKNLPALVERLVERELRKITRKAEDL